MLGLQATVGMFVQLCQRVDGDVPTLCSNKQLVQYTWLLCTPFDFRLAVVLCPLVTSLHSVIYCSFPERAMECMTPTGRCSSKSHTICYCCRQLSPEESLHQATPEGSPLEPPNPSWAPFMSGMRRKRSLAQELTDTGSAAVSIPRQVGTSAHGGLEYHR